MAEMSYRKEQQLAEYINKYVVPQQLKTRKMILTTQKNKRGECKVYIELRRYDNLKPENSKRKRISTDIWVLPRNWSTKKQEVLKQDFEYSDKNKVINDKFSRILNYINNPNIDYKFAQLSREEFTIIESVFPSKRMLMLKKCLTDYLNEYYENKKKKFVNNTAKAYLTTHNRVKAFDLQQDKKTYIEDVNFTWSDKFYDYLLNDRKFADASIDKTYTCIVAVMSDLWKKRDELQLTMNDKFKQKGFKHGAKSMNEANPLTKTQLHLLYSHDFDRNSMNQIKDRFIWQCYTGLRYCDAFTITKEHIKNNWLIIKPSKTIRHRVQVEQPLNEIALELLKKYEYDMTKLKITNQVYNRELKLMFKKLNEFYADKNKYPEFEPYDEKFGSYASRDTFISLLVQAGVNWHNILKYTGQSSFEIVNRYVKTEDEQKQNEINRVFTRPEKL